MATANNTSSTLIKRESYTAFSDLPFIADIKIALRKKRRCFWHVPPTDDYGQANDIGRQYACDLVQYLKQHPDCVGSGMLGRVIADMAVHEQQPGGNVMHGYAVGFWAFVEILLYVAATTTDHYNIAQRDADRFAAIRPARETEAADRNGGAKSAKAARNK